MFSFSVIKGANIGNKWVGNDFSVLSTYIYTFLGSESGLLDRKSFLFVASRLSS
jgi:hypothetical protein